MFDPVDDVRRSFAESVVQAFGARPGPRFALMLSGGQTARDCYEVLATRPEVDWSLVDIYIGDERFVPPKHADSNARLVRESLLDRVGTVGSFSPMPTTPGDIEACAAQYQRTMADLVTGPGIDLIHLGLGPDGHTASLFPGADSLDAGPGDLVLATEDPTGVNPLSAADPDPAGDQLRPPGRVHGRRCRQGGRRGPAAARRRHPGLSGARRQDGVAGGPRRQW